MQVEVDHEAGEPVGALPGTFVFWAPSRRRIALLDGLPEPFRQQATGFMAAEVIGHAAASLALCRESAMAETAPSTLAGPREAVQCAVNLPLTGGLDMRILAASFVTRPLAVRAQEALAGRFGTGHTRIAVLGGSEDDTEADDTVGQRPEMILAGRFSDDVIAAVRRAIVELGGTVVVDVDEDRTR